MDIVIKPKRIALILAGAIGFLAIGHGIAIFFLLYLGDKSFHGFVPLFDLGHERNLPTFYSSITLLICAALLGIIGLANWQKRLGSTLQWSALAIVFTFLSVDEVLELHEHLNEPMREIFGASGPFYFAWVIPYGIAVMLLGATYIRFFYRLPRTTLRLFLVAAALYLGGAVGMEMIGSLVMERFGRSGLYVAEYTVEELMEMTGVAVFIYALARYIETQLNDIRIRIG